MTNEVSIPLAFFGGILSFISPCVLPLVPSYISFITGISFEELTSDNDNKKLKRVVLLNSLMFVLGFSTVFVVILGSSAQLFGSVFIQYQDIIRKIGGLAIILLGIHIIGLINFKILQRDKRMHFQERPAGFLGSFLIGIGFAAGWTPCIGPILSAIFAVAATSATPWSGMMLFVAYSVGLAIPFLLTALAINTFLKHFNRLKKHMRIISIVTGIFLIATGLLIFTNSLAIISAYLNTIIPGLS